MMQDLLGVANGVFFRMAPTPPRDVSYFHRKMIQNDEYLPWMLTKRQPLRNFV